MYISYLIVSYSVDIVLVGVLLSSFAREVDYSEVSDRGGLSEKSGKSCGNTQYISDNF